MARTKKNKLILVPIILLVALAAFVYMILYNGEAIVDKTASSNVVKKISSQVLRNVGQFEITQADINGAINQYLEVPMSKGDITLKEVNTEVSNNKILIEAPFSFKTLDLLFSSTGKLGLSDGEITYNPDNFKLGKVSLPKKMVLAQISKQSNSNFYVEDNLIKIKTDALPIAINSLIIEEDKLVGTVGLKGASTNNLDSLSDGEVDSQLDAAKQKIQAATSYMNATQKEQANTILNKLEDVKSQSLEQKKQVLNYANNIIANATK
ncbi:hypothetical protein LGK95_19130 [Clostridium algoriphilum]|uniref:hypothetical protein n=1 Tax=Clostridium algoriphilum TaxID=198347 RepID=UPI001CF121B5|nr:hypothetical protein [Clostridium algoriphilum]MCB2295596.1 hypothetical protein [Clostridium algoriphilum]